MNKVDRRYKIPLVFFTLVLTFIAAALMIFPRADHSHLRKIDWWRKINAPGIEKLREELSPELTVFTTTVEGGGVGILNPFPDEELANKMKLGLEKLSPPSKVIIVPQRKRS